MTDQLSDADRDIVADVLNEYNGAIMVDMTVFLEDLTSAFGSFDDALDAVKSLDSENDLKILHSDQMPEIDLRCDGYYLLLSE